MAEKYKLEPLAKQDVKESASYYEKKELGLGGKFLDQVNIKIQEITEKPKKYSVYYSNARKAPVKIFPFTIVYIIKEAIISIIGVWHNQRDPAKMLDRIDDEQQKNNQ